MLHLRERNHQVFSGLHQTFTRAVTAKGETRNFIFPSFEQQRFAGHVQRRPVRRVLPHQLLQLCLRQLRVQRDPLHPPRPRLRSRWDEALPRLRHDGGPHPGQLLRWAARGQVREEEGHVLRNDRRHTIGHTGRIRGQLRGMEFDHVLKCTVFV